MGHAGVKVVGSAIEVNEENRWRLATPGSAGWAKSARPGDPRGKYFMLSVDNHLTPPRTLFAERIERRFVDRLARIEIIKGRKMIVQEGLSPSPLPELEYFGEDLLRNAIGAAASPLSGTETSMAERLAAQEMDGVDAELIYPNGPGLLMFSSTDPEFVMAQCRVWNDWAMEYCRPELARCIPTACIGTGDVDLAVAEIQRTAALGYKVAFLPSKPIWGPESNSKRPTYTHPDYDPIWAALQDADMAIAFHIASGKDPRTARGAGAAVMNFVVNAAAPTMEPVVALCASGVIERFPKLRFSIIEANAGFLPWLLDMMDEAYLKHHMWQRPKLREMPSVYFRTNGACSVTEDRSAFALVEEYGLVDNLMWANDYPHHEGTWPHSGEAVERFFGKLSETAREKILGLNAARFFRIEVPEKYRQAV